MKILLMFILIGFAAFSVIYYISVSIKVYTDGLQRKQNIRGRLRSFWIAFCGSYSLLAVLIVWNPDLWIYPNWLLSMILIVPVSFVFGLIAALV